MKIDEIECKACGCGSVHIHIGSRYQVEIFGNIFFNNCIDEPLVGMEIEGLHARIACGDIHIIGNNSRAFNDDD